ncbi:EpsG family protein [Pseudomonas sp. NA-150]|uniref:EpsG family protein n=1 Tax=Pseudomonas sp. NA-150 TaxID=3367525 RepID=UPI0037C61E26
MYFYLIIGLLLWVASIPGLFLKQVSDSRILKLLLISVLIFWGVCSFRFETGFDWVVYEQYFDDVGKAPFMRLPAGVVSMEPLFYLLNYVVALVGGFQLLLFVVGTFNTYCVAKFFSEFEVDGSFGLAFCFCWIFLPLQMGTIRQSIAISFVLLAMCYALSKESKKSIAFFVVAVGFQYSALLYAFVFFERVIKFLLEKIWWFTSICVVFYLSGVGLGQVVPLLSKVIHIPFLSEKLAVYVDFGLSKRTLLGAGFLFLNCFILIAAKKYITEVGRRELMVIGALICLVAAQALFFDFAIIWNRIQYLACFSQAAIIYWIMMGFSEKHRVAIAMGVIPISSLALFLFVSSPSASIFIPYQSYIQHAITGEPGDGRSRTFQYYKRFLEQNGKSF